MTTSTTVLVPERIIETEPLRQGTVAWVFKPPEPLQPPGPEPGFWRSLRRWEYRVAPGGHMRALLRTAILAVVIVLVVGVAARVVLPIILAIVTTIAEIVYNLMMGVAYLIGFLLLVSLLASGRKR